jgi:DNA-binding PadR family transcriptional regulator
MPRARRDAAAASRPNDPSLLIMTSLLGGAKHGYALLQDIEAFAGVRLGPGTLYGAISRLVQRGAIEALPASGRTRPYRLSETGACELEAALGELSVIVREGSERLARRGTLHPSALGGPA